MCGLAAILTFDGAPPNKDALVRMTSVIAHRGPDDSGFLIRDQVGIGFRRLSILDLSPAGHQPMATQDGEVVLAFNGEIFNYVELRDELRSLGHHFSSTGDTEVLLHAYLQWGSACLQKLNGMWAFVLYDRRRGVLFGSRDRFGIKPLYRWTGRGHVLIASEIKSIRASGLYRDKTNWSVVSRFFLQARMDDGSETFYDGITNISPGSAFELDLRGKLREWRYWSVGEPSQVVPNNPSNAFAEAFEEAVRLHMRSDVPVGVHLSGGLDSTAIICASARIRSSTNADGPLMAFCYTAPEFDESRYISDTLRQTSAHLVQLEMKPDRLWDLLREVLSFQDEPIYSITNLVSYELMRLTAQHGIKVVMNGQGADETIGGYPTYFDFYWGGLLAEARYGRAFQEIGRYTEENGGSRSSLFLRQLRRFIQGRLRTSGSYRRLSRWKQNLFNVNNRWFTPDLIQHIRVDEKPSYEPTNLISALAHSSSSYPLPLYLRIEDRNSMAHSVECRLPFLDHRLACLLFSLPPDWHLRGPWNKYVLREAMRDRIPESVRARVDKMGFPVPARRWVANAFSGPVLDLLSSGAFREQNLFNTSKIMEDVERHRRGDIDIAGAIFDMAQFQVWCGATGTPTPRPATPGQSESLPGTHSNPAPAAPL